MRFMLLVKSDAKAEAGLLPNEAELAEMGKYNSALAESGALLGGDGLLPSSKGARVRLARGRVRVLDGPFAESKELVAGYWIIEAKSKTEALHWAERAPFREGEVEVRPLYEQEDFPIRREQKAGGRRDEERRAREVSGTRGHVAVRKPGTKRYLC